MPETNFEKLDIYKLSERLSSLIWRIAVKWERLPQNTVGTQLVRAADSIGANIAEGSGRGSEKDYLRFLRISRGSLYETKHWLRLAFTRDLLTMENVEELRAIVDELTPKLNSYIRVVGNKKAAKARYEDQRPKTEDQ
ncbi:MAG: four helix bundle protein [Acidobacteria bacterium]|nr:four helix bundle protein [Acidobacteriota bacterium]